VPDAPQIPHLAVFNAMPSTLISSIPTQLQLYAHGILHTSRPSLFESCILPYPKLKRDHSTVDLHISSATVCSMAYTISPHDFIVLVASFLVLFLPIFVVQYHRFLSNRSSSSEKTSHHKEHDKSAEHPTEDHKHKHTPSHHHHHHAPAAGKPGETSSKPAQKNAQDQDPYQTGEMAFKSDQRSTQDSSQFPSVDSSVFTAIEDKAAELIRKGLMTPQDILDQVEGHLPVTEPILDSTFATSGASRSHRPTQAAIPRPGTPTSTKPSKPQPPPQEDAPRPQEETKESQSAASPPEHASKSSAEPSSRPVSRCRKIRSGVSLFQTIVLLLGLLLFVFAVAVLVAHGLPWFVVYKTESILSDVRDEILSQGDMRICLCAKE